MSPSASPPEPRPRGSVTAWEQGPLRPRLAPGEVQVWLAQLSRLDGVRELLSADERERASRFAHERDRLLWSSSRGALRVLLARYLDADPTDVALLVEPSGKPRVRREPEPQERAEESELHFNLSHSGELALYAFASDWPVGVDVQVALGVEHRRARDHVALARRAFGEREAQRLGELEPELREGEFLRLWTRYEAELKRVGRGIGAGDASVDEHAWVAELEVGADAAAAVAGERPARVLQAWSLG